MDETMRRRLQGADGRARALDDELESIARRLADKVRRETGWNVECEVGWEEGGLGELCMKPVRGGGGAACCRGAWEAYREREITPLFEDLFIAYDAPFGMVRGDEPDGPCPTCGRIAEEIGRDP